MSSISGAHGAEVSGDALEAFRLVTKRVAGNEGVLFTGLEHLLDHPKRFAWSEICELYDRMEKMCAPTQTLRQCGHQMFEAPRIGEMIKVGAAVASPILLYTLGNKFGLARTFNHLTVTQKIHVDGTIEVEIVIPETHQHSRGFFELTQGVLEAFPILLGLPHAKVALSISDRRGHYFVRPPESRTIVARFKRAWRAFFSGQRILEQLDQQQSELNEQFHQLQYAYADVKKALEVKQQFLSVMSHELRTPLNGIIGSADALHGETDPLIRDELHHALDESAHAMTRLVEGVLELVRSGDTVPEAIAGEVDLETMISEILADGHLSRAESRDITLAVHWTDDAPMGITSDENRLRQILDRLVDNAIKFTAKGGHVDVTLDYVDDEFVMTVADDGIGIHADDIEFIFDLFHQVESHSTRRFGGAGLGLALVQRNLEIMGGRVEVVSRPDEGARFVVHVPAAVCRSRAPEPGKSVGSDVILVVDDNRVNRLVVSRMLKRFGWKVMEAEDGAQAVALADEHDFAMIFMDCEMPVMDGWEAAQTIVATRGDLPVVALTAYVSDEDRARCREAGMVDFLAKPVTSDIIERTLDRWTDSRAIQEPRRASA